MRTSTIRFMSDPKDGKQLASLVVFGFGTLNFAWADHRKPLLSQLGGGLRITVTHTGGSTFRCLIEDAESVLHDTVLMCICAPA